jgi:hypothetical protein
MKSSDAEQRTAPAIPANAGRFAGAHAAACMAGYPPARERQLVGSVAQKREDATDISRASQLPKEKRREILSANAGKR